MRNERFVKHVIAVEAIMLKLAGELGEDEELWALAGLLHDADYELTKSQVEKHGLLAAEILKNKVPENVLRAIKAHNPRTGYEPQTKMEKALVAADAVSGLLVACALVMPSKKIAEVKVGTVTKKFKAKDFARRVDRKRILMREEMGLTKERFFEIALESLKEIAEDLGL